VSNHGWDYEIDGIDKLNEDDDFVIQEIDAISPNTELLKRNSRIDEMSIYI
jgi:hypothetical protein